MQLSGKAPICHLTSVHQRFDIRIYEKQCKSLSEYFEVNLIVADGLGNGVYENVIIHDVGLRPNNAFFRAIIMPWRLYKKARSIPHCIVFQFHDPELLFVGLIIKLIDRKKVVYDIHEDVPQDILLKTWIPKILRFFVSWIYKKIESFVVSKIDLILCATPHIRKRVIKSNPNTIDIKNYPEPQKILADSKTLSIKYDLCYIGTIALNRGIPSLLNILNKLDATFALAGVFDNRDAEVFLKSHPNWSRVSYLGVLNASEVIKLLQESKIGIVILDNTPTFVNSLPIKLFEYMTFGLAVIASDFPLWKEIIEDAKCGICIEPGDEKRLLNSIKKLLEDKDLSIEMGRNGIEAVRKKYMWTTEFEKLLKAYKLLTTVK